MPVRSYATEVIADSSGQWVGNGVRYPTREMAEQSAMDLASRWTLVRSWRVVESGDEPNRDEPVIKGAGHRVQL